MKLLQTGNSHFLRAFFAWNRSSGGVHTGGGSVIISLLSITRFFNVIKIFFVAAAVALFGSFAAVVDGSTSEIIPVTLAAKKRVSILLVWMLNDRHMYRGT